MSSKWLAAAFALRWTDVSASASSAGSSGVAAALPLKAELAERAEPAELLNAPDIVAFEERAAVLEYDGETERELAERRAAAEQGFASPEQLVAAAVAGWEAQVRSISVEVAPGGFWDRVLADARQALLQGWVRKAAALGWSEIDLFGLHPGAPKQRIDSMGLIPCLGRRPILAITQDAALIDAGGGARQRYQRNTQDPYGEAVAMWDAIRRAPSKDVE